MKSRFVTPIIVTLAALALLVREDLANQGITFWTGATLAAVILAAREWAQVIP